MDCTVDLSSPGGIPLTLLATINRLTAKLGIVEVSLNSLSRQCWDGMNEGIIVLRFWEALLPQPNVSGVFPPIGMKILWFKAGTAAVEDGTAVK
jgi:hypothetical protein